MMTIIPAADRHFTDMGWLQTYWLFSFSDYYDPANVSHGKLRVCNDDIVQPGTGFGEHPHEEMEIISIVLQGEINHRDSIGNAARIGSNDVQRMTAGTGLYHSEWNDGTEPVHFLQIWIIPDTMGLKPSYDQKSFSPDSWRNKLKLLASGDHGGEAVALNTSATLFRSRLDAGQAVVHKTGPGRHLFLYMIEGQARIDGQGIGKGDQARIRDRQRLEVAATATADFILVDIGGR